MRFKIALVQFETRQYAPDENLKKAELFAEEAASVLVLVGRGGEDT